MIKHAFLLFLPLTLALAGCPTDDEVSLGQDQQTNDDDDDSDGRSGGDGQGDGQADGATGGDGASQDPDGDAGIPDGDGGDEQYEACANKQCGDTCSPCAPNDPQCTADDLIYACNLDGECIGATEGMCGTTVVCTYQCDIQGCWSDGCAQGQQYCALEQGNEQCGGEGTCANLPGNGACDAVVDPVCGCDGRTYGNDCEAAVAGVNVAQTGPCN